MAVVGAGPIGLELASAFKLGGVKYLHFDAGQIGHTVSWMPRQMRFFSSPDRISICGVPLQTVEQEKASREEYLAYLRSIVEQFNLTVRTHEKITSIQKSGSEFLLTSEKSTGQHQYVADYVVLTTGDLNRARELNLPGEDLPHVSHYFDEPHRYFRKRLLVVGGRNSAVEAAIRCQRAGADVAVSYRGDEFDTQSVKYWLAPEIEMLIKAERVTYYPLTIPTVITPQHVSLRQVQTGQCTQVPADFVLLLVGYEMDTTLMEQVGVALAGENQAPQLDLQTMQTNVSGFYVGGTAAAGTQIRFQLFIENCHPHVGKIFKSITGRQCPFDATDKTHSNRYALPES